MQVSARDPQLVPQSPFFAYVCPQSFYKKIALSSLHDLLASFQQRINLMQSLLKAYCSQASAQDRGQPGVRQAGSPGGTQTAAPSPWATRLWATRHPLWLLVTNPTRLSDHGSSSLPSKGVSLPLPHLLCFQRSFHRVNVIAVKASRVIFDLWGFLAIGCRQLPGCSFVPLKIHL